MRNRKSAMATLAAARPSALSPSLLVDPSCSRPEGLDAILAAGRDKPEHEEERPRVRRAKSEPRRLRAEWFAVPVATATAAALLMLAVSGSPAGNPPSSRNQSGAAVAVLLPMASLAQYQAPKFGEYWQQDTSVGRLSVARAGRQRYQISQSDQVSTSIGVRSGEESIMLTGRDATTAPVSARDSALWRAAGSPKVLQVEGADLTSHPGSAGSETGAGTTWTVTIGSAKPTTKPIDAGGVIAVIGDEKLDYAGLQRLPDDPEILRVVLGKLYPRTSNTATPDSAQQSLWLFEQATNLISLPVPAGVRAAAYRVLASIPGIEDLGPVTDHAGRSGVALALSGHTQCPLGSLADELVVDPQTDSLLAVQQVLVTPSADARAAGLTPGTVVDYTTYLDIGWSDLQVEAQVGD